MHDLVIRGGTVVDGSGEPAFTADVAVANGVIVEIGKGVGAARRTIDADGALVTPGFLDIHTHYDGQLLWDDALDPSFSNGVTTAVAGNCGVGFAPAAPEHRAKLIEFMEGVEDIPGIVLDEGLDWEWESFPDYMDRLDRRRLSMDVATHVTHAPLRLFIMGERALRHEAATPEDIAQMQQLVREGMAAGAVGVSGSRILEHLSSKGENVPGTFAADDELIALATAMAESGRGIFQIVPLGGAGDSVGTQVATEERLAEHARLVRIAEASGRPLNYVIHSYNHAPEEWRELFAASEAANARGLEIRPQIAARGLGLLLSLDGLHIFRNRPSYREIAHLKRKERAAAMRDPARRVAILREADLPAQASAYQMLEPLVPQILHRYYVLEGDYEPDASKRLDVIAESTGRTLPEVLYDTLSAGEGNGTAAYFALNYTHGNLDSVYEMLKSPLSLSGLSDGGAHLQLVCDGAMPTFHLSFWARDRVRGPKLPLELMVAKITGQPSAAYGFQDRGLLKPGRRADINVIDFDRLGNDPPEMRFDLPLGGARYMQRGRGYLATMVGGEVTREGDEDTGLRPGRLVRMR